MLLRVHHPEPFKSDDRSEIEDPIQVETDMMYKDQSKEEEINTEDQTKCKTKTCALFQISDFNIRIFKSLGI